MKLYPYEQIVIDRLMDDCRCGDLYYNKKLIDRIAIMQDEQIEIKYENDSIEPVILSYERAIDEIKNSKFEFTDEWDDEFEDDEDEEL